MLKRDSYTVSLLPVHREFLNGERFIWEIYSDISGMEAKLFSGELFRQEIKVRTYLSLFTIYSTN